MSAAAIILKMKDQYREPQDAESFLAMLYDCYDDLNGLDDKNIKADSAVIISGQASSKASKLAFSWQSKKA